MMSPLPAAELYRGDPRLLKKTLAQHKVFTHHNLGFVKDLALGFLLQSKLFRVCRPHTSTRGFLYLYASILVLQNDRDGRNAVFFGGRDECLFAVLGDNPGLYAP